MAKKTEKLPLDYSSLEAFAEQAARRLKSGEELSGKDGILAPLIKQIVEASLEGELDVHLSEERSVGNPNRRNGKTSKQLRTEYGPIELQTSRDRAGALNLN